MNNENRGCQSSNYRACLYCARRGVGAPFHPSFVGGQCNDYSKIPDMGMVFKALEATAKLADEDGLLIPNAIIDGLIDWESERITQTDINKLIEEADDMEGGNDLAALEKRIDALESTVHAMKIREGHADVFENKAISNLSMKEDLNVEAIVPSTKPKLPPTVKEMVIAHIREKGLDGYTYEEMVAEHLSENGYDGLWCEECGCHDNDLSLCGSICQDGFISTCRAGYKIPCDCGEGCEYHIGPEKPKEEGE